MTKNKKMMKKLLLYEMLLLNICLGAVAVKENSDNQAKSKSTTIEHPIEPKKIDLNDWKNEDVPKVLLELDSPISFAIEPKEAFIFLEDYNLAEYLKVMNYDCKLIEDPKLVVEKKLSDERIAGVSKYYDLVDKYCQIYGFDTSLAMAILAQEYGVGCTEVNEGGAIGLYQNQAVFWNDKNITAYNFQTGKYDTIHIENHEELKYNELNIRAFAMTMQNYLKTYDGDVIAAFAAWNQGTNYINSIRKDGTNYVWLDQITDKHGDHKYVKQILSFVEDDLIVVQYPNESDEIKTSITILEEQENLLEYKSLDPEEIKKGKLKGKSLLRNNYSKAKTKVLVPSK